MSILILAYNRLENLKQLIKSIESIDTCIYISVDGGTSKRCAEVQSYCQNLKMSQPHKYEIQLLKENNGVKRGVIKGVDWYFTHQDVGIILEEDLEILVENFEIIHNSIIEFVRRNKDTVINLSSFYEQYNDQDIHTLEFRKQDDFFMWGWVCQKETWLDYKDFLPDPDLKKFLSSLFVSTYFEKIYWKLIFRMLRLNQIDSWGYFFLIYTVANKQNYAPNLSIIRNRGLKKGTNYNRLSMYAKALALGDMQRYSVNSVRIMNTKTRSDIANYDKVVRHNITLLSILRIIVWNVLPLRRVLKGITK